MDQIKTWVALTAVAAFAVLAGGWFLLVSPKRAEAGDLRSQAATQRSTNQVLANSLAVLKAQAKDLPVEQAKLAGVALKIPSEPAQPELLRDLMTAAVAADVEFVSFAPGAVALATATTTAPTTATTAATATATSPTGTATAAAASPTSGVGVLQVMPVTITVAGGYFDVEQYLLALEDLPRALRVTGLSLAPGSSPASPTGSSAPASSTATQDGSSLLVNITGNVYVTSGAAPSAPVAVPAG